MTVYSIILFASLVSAEGEIFWKTQEFGKCTRSTQCRKYLLHTTTKNHCLPKPGFGGSEKWCARKCNDKNDCVNERQCRDNQCRRSAVGRECGVKMQGGNEGEEKENAKKCSSQTSGEITEKGQEMTDDKQPDAQFIQLYCKANGADGHCEFHSDCESRRCILTLEKCAEGCKSEKDCSTRKCTDNICIQAEIDDTCVFDDDCKFGKCEVTKGDVEGKCELIKIGELCSTDNQCGGEAECKNRNENKHRLNKVCRRKPSNANSNKKPSFLKEKQQTSISI